MDNNQKAEENINDLAKDLEQVLKESPHWEQLEGGKWKSVKPESQEPTVFIATVWDMHDTTILGVFTESKLAEAEIAKGEFEDAIGSNVKKWIVKNCVSPPNSQEPAKWPKELIKDNNFVCQQCHHIHDLGGWKLVKDEPAQPASEFVELLRVFIGKLPSPYCYTAQLEQRALEACDRLEAVEKERDLAIAHDRQPYPTAQAYEKVCAALHLKEGSLEAEAEISQKALEACTLANMENIKLQAKLKEQVEEIVRLKNIIKNSICQSYNENCEDCKANYKKAKAIEAGSK